MSSANSMVAIEKGKILGLIRRGKAQEVHSLVLSGGDSKTTARDSIAIFEGGRGMTAVIKRTGNHIDSVVVSGPGAELANLLVKLDPPMITKTRLAEMIVTDTFFN